MTKNQIEKQGLLNFVDEDNKSNADIPMPELPPEVISYFTEQYFKEILTKIYHNIDSMKYEIEILNKKIDSISETIKNMEER